MHLNIDQLVDIAEGTRPEASAPHLAACESCRAQLDDLRATLSAARDVSVPEPSPLFWDHLSARVSEAVAADARLPPSRSFGGALAAMFSSKAFHAGVLSAALGLLIAVVLVPRAHAPAPIASPPRIVLTPKAVADAVTPTERLLDVAPEDASLTLVASLTDDVDLDTAREAGLAPGGSAEHAVTHMSDGELRELGRLLREELARSGA
jgi:hypothetical protein